MSGSIRRDNGRLAETVLGATAFSLLSLGCGYGRATGESMGTVYSIQADCPGSLPHQGFVVRPNG